METVKEIAEHLIASTTFKSADIVSLHEYIEAKEATGAPTVLEDMILTAAGECQHAADKLQEYLSKAAKEAAEGLAAYEKHGVRTSVSIWFVLDGRVTAETLAHQLRMKRDALCSLIRAWVSVADRVVATDAEREAVEKRAQERAEQRRAAQIAAWCKRPKEDIVKAAVAHGVPTAGKKEDIAAAIVDAGGYTC